MSQYIVMFGCALIVVISSPALGAESQSTCSADIQKFCKDIPTGEGKVLDCLIKNSDSLSDACRAHVNTAQVYRSCIDDIMRLCPETDPIPGKGILCLRRNRENLSRDCRNELRRMPL